MTNKTLLSTLLLVLGMAADVQAGDDFALKAKRILFLGDSITNAGHYVAEIETQLRLRKVQPLPEMINAGLSSETCSGLSEPDHPFPRPDVHERLDRALEKAKPDVVVACYGMNDGIYYPFAEERFAAYQAGIRKLVAKVHAAGARIILVTPPPFDAAPLRGKEGKLLPAGADKYAWFAVYENYDEVLKAYGSWVLQQSQLADMVIDVHQPLLDYLADVRLETPEFYMAADGVHMDETGHRVMAKSILNAWGITEWREPSVELRVVAKKKERLLHDSWLSHIGHQRPGVPDGMPLGEAIEKAQGLDKRIVELVTNELR